MLWLLSASWCSRSTALHSLLQPLGMRAHPPYSLGIDFQAEPCSTALAWNLRQPWQLLRTCLDSRLSLGTQCLARKWGHISATPPWRIRQWASCTSFMVYGWVYGRYIGYSPCRRPWHSRIPCSFFCRFSCSWSSSVWPLLWARLIQKRCSLLSSSVFSGPLLLWFRWWREFCVNHEIHAQTLMAFLRPNLSR